MGEASVVMAISSPHRQDGQEAIQHAVTLLKASVPIWKKVGTRPEPGQNQARTRPNADHLS